MQEWAVFVSDPLDISHPVCCDYHEDKVERRPFFHFPEMIEQSWVDSHFFVQKFCPP